MAEDAKLTKYIRITSIVLFALSLTQKCYCTTTQCGDSIMAFLLGWAAAFSGGAGVAWFANPLLFVSWILLKKNLKVSMYLSALATLMALSFLLFDAVTDNESGGQHTIISYKAGYWIWLSSSVCMLAGTVVLVLNHRTTSGRIGERSNSSERSEYLH